MEHLRVEHLRTSNWEGALRGMRNPLESWQKSDSKFYPPPDLYEETEQVYDHDGLYSIGPNDLELAMKLVKAGRDHRKFLRQIFISCDIIAPWYWWKEYDTYQVGTVENSTSQMHKLGSRLLERSDWILDLFAKSDKEDKLTNEEQVAMRETLQIVTLINKKIERWQAHKKEGKHGNIFWRDMIQCIPGSYIYRRTCTLNYEVMANMYHSRKDHKLIEWREFCQHMVENLPYPQLFTG